VRKRESEYFDAFKLLNADIWMEGMQVAMKCSRYSPFFWNSQCICTRTFGNRPQKYIALLSYLLMELSPYWEAANFTATHELPSILRNSKVHHRVHKSPPLVPIRSQIDPVHTIPTHLRSILILSAHLRLSLPSSLFSSGFPNNILYGFLVSPIRATRPAHLILLDLIIIIMFGEEYKWWSSSLCSFLQPPVTSSPC
jgi:hypothetical protein